MPTTTTTAITATPLEITAEIVDSDRVSDTRTAIVAAISIACGDDRLDMEVSGYFDIETMDLEPTDTWRAEYAALTLVCPGLLDAIERAVLELTEIDAYPLDEHGCAGECMGSGRTIDAARADTHAHGCNPDDVDIGCICDDLVYLRVVRE